MWVMMKVEAEMEHIVGADILGDLPVTPPVGCDFTSRVTRKLRFTLAGLNQLQETPGN